jgi:alanyl-tRNA synthetase
MQSQTLRQKFLDFFQAQGHALIGSGSVIPENDPTVLFTTAGMHPLVPYLLGQSHPAGVRLANVQKCVRTDDIDEVGDATHLTFFEMLGYWSLGDYHKEQAIRQDFEFFTQTLGIPLERFAVSVFEGDENAPRDTESAEIWQSLGIAPERIAYLNKKENWWGPAGQTGPCGPDTEMFYWTGETPAPANYQASYEDPHWVEIGNSVFMEYNKAADGTYSPLAQKNVDTGLGFERILTVLSGKNNVYETDLFTGILAKLRELAPAADTTSLRIMADHLRAATFIIGDERGVTPSNTDQGYIVRRLLRRALRHARKGGADFGTAFTPEIARVVIAEYSTAYRELAANQDRILAALADEEAKFLRTLEKGEKELADYLTKGGKIDGAKAFYFYETYGFPRELTEEYLAEQGQTLADPAAFEQALAAHTELSRTASAGRFAGGLADHGEETTALHTATHLLHAALRQVLGEEVAQRGSNITAERLRFDFVHSEKMTDEQKAEVERIVNEQIARDLPVTMTEMTVTEAKAAGAIGIFDDKYGDKVKVYTVGDFSKEICGGPHVAHTGLLGTFQIKKEEASSAGVRRIKAVLTK